MPSSPLPAACIYAGWHFFGARRTEILPLAASCFAAKKGICRAFFEPYGAVAEGWRHLSERHKAEKGRSKKRRLRKAPARDIALSAVPCSASCESGWPWGVFACAALFLWAARHFFFACGDARKRENTYHCQCY